MEFFQVPGRQAFFPVFIMFAALTACEENKKIEPVKPNTWQAPIVVIESENLPERYTVIGSVVADKNINISSRISSYVRQVNVDEGETIEEGQLLIVLDNEELTHNINQAKAAVEAAQAVLTDVSTDLDRFNNLLE